MSVLETPVAQELLQKMTFRCIGPPRGGRVVAVAGDPRNRAVYYFGAAAGGVWKTEDAGTTWRNVSDGYLKTSSVGAIAVSSSDPNVIFAGMGESCIRLDVSHGDGVYRSGDGGQTWKHCGLEDTRHIGEVRIHPTNPDLVYVAALGHAFGPNEERGLYRSSDGGANWERILHTGDKAGAVDVVFDPRHPETIYATTWETHRNFWELSSGGPGSGIWKSTDGGDTWDEITRNKGLPQTAIFGKVGVAASPVKTGRVWALVEASEKPGLYRSEDFGESWELINEKNNLRYRPWYYMHVFADTQEADTVYINNLDMFKSTDGGKKFERIGTPHGDNHDLWIDPTDNQRMVQGNDGGANVSFNGGETWSTIYNQLTAQFYKVATDTREPYYNVYGTQQDNSSIAVPSGANDGAITMADTYPAGSGESGFITVHPDDPDLVYVGAVGSSPGGGGSLQRYDHRSGQIRLVNVWPELHSGIGPGELAVRFAWTFPILFSPHDPGIIYAGGNAVFRTDNEGQSWDQISPDLTRNDPDKLGVSGGPITKDTSGAEHYCTLATLRECPLEPGVLWAGSDDGLVHVSRNGGDDWVDVTPPDLPEWAFVRNIEPSPHRAGEAYLTATKYKLDDNTPYVFRTTDYGANWDSIAAGIPSDDFVRVLRCDPAREGLLYLGTETGLYVSTDDGGSWHRWDSTLPVTPVYDMTVKGTDLVVATHGRSFWIMDDLTPLHQLMDDGSDSTVRLFQPRSAWRILPNIFAPYIAKKGRDYWVSLGKAAINDAGRDESNQVVRTYHDSGTSNRVGAMITYVLPDDIDPATVSLEILDVDGEEVRRFGPKPPGYADMTDDEIEYDVGTFIPAAPGVNRFLWDLRYDGSTRVPGNKLGADANDGPMVVPGEYRVQLTVGGESFVQTFEVVNDPRAAVSPDELGDQVSALLDIRDKISEAHEAINKIRSVRGQLHPWMARDEMSDEVREAAQSLDQKLTEIEEELIVPGEHKDLFGGNTPSRLTEKLASVISVIASADGRPTDQSLGVAAQYSEEIDEQLHRLDGVLSEDVAAFNTVMAGAQHSAIEA